jgi:hypothetical protein
VLASFWVYVGRMVDESISREGCRPPSALSRPWGCTAQHSTAIKPCLGQLFLVQVVGL